MKLMRPNRTLMHGAALVAVAVATGCGATDDFVQSGEEFASETHINDFQLALAEEDYDAACEELAPEGFASIVSGGKAGGGLPARQVPGGLGTHGHG